LDGLVVECDGDGLGAGVVGGGFSVEDGWGAGADDEVFDGAGAGAELEELWPALGVEAPPELLLPPLVGVDPGLVDPPFVPGLVAP
jgi:hypothetical protein